MNIEELTDNRRDAQKHLDQLQEWAKYNADPSHLLMSAFDSVSQAERALAAAQGQEYAEPLDMVFFPEGDDLGVRLLQDQHEAFLACNAIIQKSDGVREGAGLAIIEFIRCSVTKFGYPNDEALPGHPLHHPGQTHLNLSITLKTDVG